MKSHPTTNSIDAFFQGNCRNAANDAYRRGFCKTCHRKPYRPGGTQCEGCYESRGSRLDTPPDALAITDIYGDVCGCGKSLARLDSNLCELCTAKKKRRELDLLNAGRNPEK